MAESLDLQDVSKLRTGGRRSVFLEAPARVFDDAEIRTYLAEHPETLVWLMERRADFSAPFYDHVLKHFTVRWRSTRLRPATRILALVARQAGLPEALVAEFRQHVDVHVSGRDSAHLHQAKANAAFQILLHTDAGLAPWSLVSLLGPCTLERESILAALEHPDLGLEAWPRVEARIRELDRKGNVPPDVRDYDGLPPAVRKHSALDVAHVIVGQEGEIAAAMYRRARAWLRAAEEPQLKAVLLQSECPEIRLDAITHLRRASDGRKGRGRGR